MHHYLDKEKHVFSFSAQNSPALMIESGDTVTVVTMDCFSDQIQTVGDRIESVDFDRVNPATGPIFVKGAEKGDSLKVKILKIDTGDRAVMLTGKGLGVLGHKLEDMHLKILPIKQGRLQFDERTTLPLRPMIGVIGVAPEGEAVNCGTPDSHGGNMDTALIKVGADVFLPVYTEGALLAIGDLHAAMGDGEVSVSGAEVPGEVTVEISLIKELTIKTPLVRNEDLLAVIHSRKSLDDAVNGAVEIMEELIAARTDLSSAEIIMLLSVAGRVRISQVVDPLKTARCEIPLEILNNYGFKLY